jgi:hypothetical protein
VTLPSLDGTFKASSVYIGVYLFMFKIVRYISLCINNISKAVMFVTSDVTKADANTDMR